MSTLGAPANTISFERGRARDVRLINEDNRRINEQARESQSAAVTEIGQAEEPFQFDKSKATNYGEKIQKERE